MKNWLSALFFFLTEKAHAQLSDFGVVDFKRADSVAAVYKGEDLHHLPLLAHQLTAPLETEVEKFRAIYTWVCANISSDYILSERIDNKREKFNNDSVALAGWNTFYRQKVFDKLLKEKKTVCTGYAYLVRELAMAAGIKCEIVNGYGKTADSNVLEPSVPNHSWNSVQLNGKWYLCDATWSSGYHESTGNTLTFVFDYQDGYFLAAPEFFIKNHYPLDTSWILLPHKPGINEFVRAPLIYHRAFEHHVFPFEPSEMEIHIAKGDTITLRLKTDRGGNKKTIYLKLDAPFHSRIIKPDDIGADGILTFNFLIDKPGNYDAHITCNNDVVVTYTVWVK